MKQNKVKFYIGLFGMVIMIGIFIQYHMIAQPTSEAFIFFGKEYHKNFIVDLVLYSFIFVAFLTITMFVEMRYE